MFQSARLQSLFLCPVVLHLTCVGKTQQIYGDLLTNIFKMGIRNLLIVRGDNYTKALSKEDPVQHPCFKSPLELLAFIRCKFADCFCIGVPVYPSIVTDPDRMQQSIDLLQEKIRLGAGFAITQALIDHNQFGAFVSELRNRNIYLPVVGGLLPITSAKSYQTVKSFGKASLQILNEPQIQACNDDDDSICEVSLAAHVRLAAECLRNQQTNLLHIFTLNHIEIAHRLVIAAAQPDTIF